MPNFEEIDTGEVGNNGHQKVDNMLSHDAFDNMFSGRQMASALEKFTEPGKTPRELLMRDEFDSEDQMTDLVILNWLAIHFSCLELQNLILDKMAGLVSIHGKRMQMVKEAVMGRPDSKADDHKMKSLMVRALGDRKDDGGE